MSPNDPRDEACSDDWAKPIEANTALSSRCTYTLTVLDAHTTRLTLASRHDG